MQESTSVTFMSSEKHKDFKKILYRFSSISPILVEVELKSIANGFIADDSINVHNFSDIGKRWLMVFI